jgi:hypothetical protein
MAQGTCQPGFVDTARTGDYQVSAIPDPFSGQKLLEQGFIEMPGGAVTLAHYDAVGGVHPIGMRSRACGTPLPSAFRPPAP